MGTIRFATHAAVSVAAVLALACCGGSQPPVSSAGVFQPSAVHPTLRAREVGPSFIAPGAKQHELVYVSDPASHGVTIYALRKMKAMGALIVNDAGGPCSDQAGDIFVPGISQIFEYAHGGPMPIKTLNDPDGSPESCAVDPSTGNLAVANFIDSSGTGTVLIYADASGAPTQYTAPNIYVYYYLAYDDNGNLFVDGRLQGTDTVVLDELAKGSSGLTQLTLNHSIGSGGGVQWDGKYVAVGDQSNNTIYQFSISGSIGTIVGSTVLGGAYDVVGFWLPRTHHGAQASSIIGADFGQVNYSSTFAGALDYWSYPGGGMPTATITSGVENPIGVTVSGHSR